MEALGVKLEFFPFGVDFALFDNDMLESRLRNVPLGESAACIGTSIAGTCGQRVSFRRVTHADEVVRHGTRVGGYKLPHRAFLHLPHFFVRGPI